MEPFAPDSPVAAVLRTSDLVGEIICRIGSSTSMIRCSAVNSTWLGAKKSPYVAGRFAELNKPAFLGFMVEFLLPTDFSTRVMRLVYPMPSQGEESAVALRPHVDATSLAGDTILGSLDGIILTQGTGLGESLDSYYLSCPCRSPRVYTVVSNIIPSIPGDPVLRQKNIFGQFGVLPDAGDSGFSMFVKDSAPGFFCSYDGVSFSSKESIFIHVCVYTGGMWNRYVSNPIPSLEIALFHRNPYSVLLGKKLYLMYVVPYIICFDLVTSSFSQIQLPADLNETVSSWYDYTVASHQDVGLALVHYRRGKIDTWIMSPITHSATWNLESRIDIVELFGTRVPACLWSRVFSRELFPLGSDNLFSVQVRNASPNAGFVLLSLGFDRDNLYELDILGQTVREIPISIADGFVGRIHPLSEPWPPQP